MYKKNNTKVLTNFKFEIGGSSTSKPFMKQSDNLCFIKFLYL